MQALQAVASLTKFYARSMHIGHQRVTKAFLAQHSLHNDCTPELTALQSAWSVQHIRQLDTVIVRTFHCLLVVCAIDGVVRSNMSVASAAWLDTGPGQQAVATCAGSL